MNQQKKDADEILFNPLLDTCSRIRDIPPLERTLAKMKEWNVLPSVVTYGTVVKAYGKANNVEEALEVWKEMEARDLGMNAVTYRCLLDALGKWGYTDKALYIFEARITPTSFLLCYWAYVAASPRVEWLPGFA